MTEDKPWYNDGCLVFILLLAALFLGPAAYRYFIEGRPPVARLTMRAGVRHNIFTSPDFGVKVWHEHPGGLQNGSVEVRVGSKALKADNGQQSEVQSFQDWPAGEANGKWFYFPLRRVESKDVIHVWSQVKSADTWPLPTQSRWRDGEWLKNETPQQQPAAQPAGS